MFNDAALINRQNVGSDVKVRVSASKEFLLMEVKSRLIAACLEELNITDMESCPSSTLLPEDIESKTTKRSSIYLLTFH